MLAKDPYNFLNLLLLGHPFKERKEILWQKLVRAFLWSVWIERNHRTSDSKEKTYPVFFL